MQDSNLLSYKRQIYSLMCISSCTDSRYVRCRSCIYAAIPPIPAGPVRCVHLCYPPWGSHNRCPHCGGVERRSKNNEKPVYPVLLYHISINFSSAESPHFSTVYGFCRKKFKKNLKNGLTYTACSAMMWIQRKSGTPQGRLKGERK